MIPTVATVTMVGDLPERITAAAQARFEAIELFDADLEAFGGNAQAVRQMTDAAGLQIASYFPLRDVEGIAPQNRDAVLKRAAAYMDTAVSLGSPMIMMCSAIDPTLSGIRDDIVADLARLADLAAERELKLAYEALSWGQYVFDYRDASRLVVEVDHPALGLVLDSFHVFARQHPLGEIAQIPKERIFLVQISDAPRLNLGYQDWSRHHRTLPGRGVFDLAAFALHVRETGYDGIVSLECFDDQLKALPATDVARQGRDSISGLWQA